MREVAKAKAASFRGKFSKYTVVANPKLGDQFLEEVQHSFGCCHILLSFNPLLIRTLELQQTLTILIFAIQITKH